MGVEIKGSKEGFSVIIDPQLDFFQAREQLLAKFEESKEFFKGSTFNKLSAPNLRHADVSYLKSLLTEMYGVEFADEDSGAWNRQSASSVHDAAESDDTAESAVPQSESLTDMEHSFERFREKLTSFDETIDKIKEITAKAEVPIIEEDSGVHDLKTKFLFENLRSGAEVDYDGNVVIFGDVNPGAKVTATGSILVLGSFRGMAHAGRGNPETAFLAALRLLPLQIRIGDLFAVPPKDANMIENAMVKILNNEIRIEQF